LSGRICPWWLGYFLVSPLRRFLHDPKEILTPYVKDGMTVLEIGGGMGFFTLPLAEMTGKAGKVISIDLQERMVRGLMKRAAKAGLENRIEARVCTTGSLNIDDLARKVDFALAFAVIHEVPDKERLLSEISGAMKQDGKLLIADPKGHESEKNFNGTVAMAEAAGLLVLDRPLIRRSYAVLLLKGAGR
jgi:ubiquinone/menaquinone biosynthesis C-methylase UbiE